MKLATLSAGAPLLPRKLIKFGGDPSYAFSLVVATSLAAILTVPASLALLQPLLPIQAGIDVGRVAATILKTFLLPLAVGMAVRAFAIDLADRLGDPLMSIAGALLALGALVVIFTSWRLIVEIGLPSMLAFAGFTLVALATGHWLGGPDEGHRTSLAVACATRHIGLALLNSGQCERTQDSGAGGDLPVRFSASVHSLRPLETASRRKSAIFRDLP